ncbi:MAG: hypothetical protein RLZZ383_1266 [Pseudomonadota bacterium]
MPVSLSSYASSQPLAMRRVVEAAETSVLRRVAGAVALDYGEGRQLHAFDFGGIVLVDVSPQDAAPVLALLSEGGDKPDNDGFLLEEGGAIRVGFDAVRLPDRNPDLLRIVARVLAQSSALDRIERKGDELLDEVARLVDDLRDDGRIERSEIELAKFIGDVLHTRAVLVRRLAVLDKPEETWEDQRASELHGAMVRTFEIEERFKSLSEKLDLVQDSLEVITDVYRSRHSNKLEWLVIALISVEIGFTLLEWAGIAG